MYLERVNTMYLERENTMYLERENTANREFPPRNRRFPFAIWTNTLKFACKITKKY